LEKLFSLLLTAAPGAFSLGLLITLFVLLTGSGFTQHQGSCDRRDGESERKRKQRLVLIGAFVMLCLALYAQSPLPCLGVLPIFVFIWLLL
jgi:hypothetical protein